MADQWEPHVVTQGDHVEKLAFLRGASPDEVWNDARNAPLKAKRENMHQLSPGDVIYLPSAPVDWLPLSEGASNTFTARLPMKHVRLVIRGHDGRPVANAPYVVQGLALREGEAAPRGQTDASGALKLAVPITQREVTVVLPRHHVEYQLRIGDLDPKDTESGARQRLKNLGFLAPNAPPDGDISYSIAAFQRSVGLPITRHLDAATLDALHDATWKEE
jgi:hypothetical protein